ncbi:MAG: flagellar basal body protein [Planctomycetota bacterium]|jgi:flagellar basal-body rod protein FlgC|nr:flagellar basal body protein [Planctomycetota bacterium]
MSVNSLQTSMSAIRANQFRLDVSANNVANVNTSEFRASEVAATDAAYVNSIGAGVRIAATYASPRQGPATIDAAAGATSQGTLEQSNTDLVTEMTNQMNSRNAYTANIAAGRTQMDVSQTLLDLVG